MPSALIQWFPGHMAKTRRLITENLKYVDLTVEVRDARIPESSANPELSRLCGAKPILTVFSKSSLSDPVMTARYTEYFQSRGARVVFLDSVSGEGLGKLRAEIDRLLQAQRARYDGKGMTGRTLKAMIVGIPNVGKSCLINRISASSKTKVENRPGVTLTKQWVTTSVGLDLLDMPGVLWPKFENQRIGEKLAACGSIKNDILDTERIAISLCGMLSRLYPKELAVRYKLDPANSDIFADSNALFLQIGKKRGMLLRGGEIDTERCANMLLDDFRSARIGRITLDRPGSVKSEEPTQNEDDSQDTAQL